MKVIRAILVIIVSSLYRKAPTLMALPRVRVTCILYTVRSGYGRKKSINVVKTDVNFSRLKERYNFFSCETQKHKKHFFLKKLFFFNTNNQTVRRYMFTYVLGHRERMLTLKHLLVTPKDEDTMIRTTKEIN